MNSWWFMRLRVEVEVEYLLSPLKLGFGVGSAERFVTQRLLIQKSEVAKPL